MANSKVMTFFSIMSIAVVLILLLIFISAKGYLTGINISLIKAFHKQSQNLIFKYTREDCDGGPLFDPYFKKISWKEPNTLYCKVIIPANCGDYFWTGDYRLENEKKICLEIKIYQREFLACGACPVYLEYEIKGLKKQNYQIEINYGGYLVTKSVMFDETAQSNIVENKLGEAKKEQRK